MQKTIRLDEDKALNLNEKRFTLDLDKIIRTELWGQCIVSPLPLEENITYTIAKKTTLKALAPIMNLATAKS